MVAKSTLIKKAPAIFMDMDGTVAESCQVISSDMAKILTQLDKWLIFVSGTDVLEMFRMVSKPLGEKSHIIMGSSGGVCFVVDAGEKTPLYAMRMGVGQKALVINALIAATAKFRLPAAPDQIIDRQTQVTLSCLGRFEKHSIKKTWDEDRAKRTKIVRYLEEELGRSFTIKIGGTTSVDITSKRVNKAAGVQRVCDFYGLDISSCVYIGDQLQEGGNDHVMTTTDINCIPVGSVTETFAILSTTRNKRKRKSKKKATFGSAIK